MPEKKEVSLFPRNLYRKGGDLIWGKKENTYSTILVTNEEEMEEALDDGWLDSFSDAIFGEAKVEDEIEEDDDF